MEDITQFYYLVHIFTSLTGAVLLLAIYGNIKNRYIDVLIEDDSHKRVDKGLIYLSLALFVWVLSGVWGIIEIKYNLGNRFISELLNNLLSILNNSFILMALFYFYYAPSFIYQHIKNVRILLGIIVSVAAATMILSYNSDNDFTNGIKISGIPDLLLSAFLSYLLATSLAQTFLRRGIKTIAVISVVVVLLMISSQLSEVFEYFHNDYMNYLVKLISKTSLIAIFLVLATSWVIRLSSTPRITEMQLKVMDWSLIKLSIPSKNIIDEQIDFGSKTVQFKNLLKLAIRRKHATGNELSISVGKAGEISNQSYLNRIITNINEHLNLSETESLDRRDLLTFIGEGKYRLRILPSHITIDEALLQEFLNAPENVEYKEFTNNK